MGARLCRAVSLRPGAASRRAVRFAARCGRATCARLSRQNTGRAP